MIVLEAKLRGTESQLRLLDEAIRTAQFVRNKALRYWMDNQGTNRNSLQKLCTVLRKEFEWCKKLSAQACQASADRAWAAISRFYENCQKQISGKKGYPKFKKNCRSVEYKVTGWVLSDDRRFLTFKDGFKAGQFKLMGTRNLNFYEIEQIKRVRVVRRADGYYAQFCVDVERKEKHDWTSRVVGIDVGLEFFYTDSDSVTVENPKFLRKSEKALKRFQRRLSKKQKGSNNRAKARIRLGRRHLKVSRQRKDWACKTAQALVKSADMIAYKDLQVRDVVRNHKLAKSIYDAAWSEFFRWVEYFAKIHGIVTVAVPTTHIYQNCLRCDHREQKSLRACSHECNKCGLRLHPDYKIARKILVKGLELLGKSQDEISKILNTVGRTEFQAWGDWVSDILGETPDVLYPIWEPGTFKSDLESSSPF